jgi:hypothetical protein
MRASSYYDGLDTIGDDASLSWPTFDQARAMASIRPLRRDTASSYLKIVKAVANWLRTVRRAAGGPSGDTGVFSDSLEADALDRDADRLGGAVSSGPDPVAAGTADDVGRLLERALSTGRGDIARLEAQDKAIAEIPSDLGKAIGKAAGGLASGAASGVASSVPWWLWGVGAAVAALFGYGAYQRIRGR